MIVDLGEAREHLADLVRIDRRVGAVLELHQPSALLEARAELVGVDGDSARVEGHVQAHPVDAARYAHLWGHGLIADRHVDEVVGDVAVPGLGQGSEPFGPEGDRLLAVDLHRLAGLVG